MQPVRIQKLHPFPRHKIIMNDKKQDILSAALDEFSAKSYDDASLNAIIKNSNTSKGTFYYYFKDKADLYIQLLRQAVQQKWDFIREELSRAAWDQPDQDIFDIFSEQALIGLKFADNFPKFYSLSENFLKERDNPIYNNALEEISFEQNEMHGDLFLEAYSNGQLNTDFSVEFIRNTSLFLFSHFDEINPTSITLEEKVDNLQTLVEFLKVGFGKQP